jgi:peptidyl-prolyl cis-trans isomerase D
MRTHAKWIWIVVFVAFVGGFLLYEVSGLAGRSGPTTSTVVASVNGRDIGYIQWVNASQQLAQQQEQQQTRGLTLDERKQIDNQAFDQLVMDVLLQQEYDKRGIRVTDAEIIEAAKYSPPPQFAQAPELQTDGRFDPSKYQRFLASPGAKAQGILSQLEAYYRTELPKQKLFTQIAGDVFVSDARLWQIWKDQHDSASVSTVAFRPVLNKDATAAVSDAEAQKYYESHSKQFDRPGRALLSIVTLDRKPTAADSLETLKRVQAIREELVKGAKFDDVAKRESDDSVSAVKGGSLGKGPKGRFVKKFEDAAFALKVGELSQVVPTEFGFHIIKVDEKKGDTITVRHILKLLKQGDSSATATDRKADQLAKIAAGSDVPAKFDSAAKSMNLLVSRLEVMDGDQAVYLGRTVPSAGAWAFGGAKIGESSDLFDDDQAYYMVRLDSLRQGGVQPLANVKDEVKQLVAREKALANLLNDAKAVAQAAASGTLEAAAQAKGLTVAKEGPFTRAMGAPGLGGVSEATGAAFTAPIGQVTGPIKTDNAVFVFRVDKRVESDEKAWAVQKTIQREQITRSLREQRVRMYLDNLRKAADLKDHRKEIQASVRRTAS